MPFTEVPFLDRCALARKAGFTHVEHLFPCAFKAEDVKAALNQDEL
jgi:hydroxypyruvate isomerase